MKLSLNGRPTRHDHCCNCYSYQASCPISTSQLSAMPTKTSMESVGASSKHRWSYSAIETFTTIAFFPRFLVFFASAFSLISTFYLRSYFDFPFNITPLLQFRQESPSNAATILKALDEEYAKTTAPRCKWEKYANWPYSSEFTGLLSPNRRKLLYVKTPKSSSSTTAHILQRYTSREGLIVGYPNFAENEWTFQTDRSLRDALNRRNVTEFDALVSHIVYRKPTVDSVLGISRIAGGNSNNSRNSNHQGTLRPFRMTSVREPITRSWSMYAHGAASAAARDFAMGADNPMDFARKLDFDGQLNYAAGYRYAIENPTVENVASHYDHIVVSERVLESFVTLAPKLGLRASDLLYLSQKRNGYAKKIIARYSNRTGHNKMSAEEKDAIDAIIREKTQLDKRLHELANARLDAELKSIPHKVRRILNDIPGMMKAVRSVCGMIGPEDNSCLAENEIVWDGNQMCFARCVQRWANRNIRCGQARN